MGKGPQENREYKKVDYHLGEKDLGEYPFLAAALHKHYEIDQTILIGTTHSMWEEVYKWFCEYRKLEFVEDVWTEIGDQCEKNNYEAPLDSVPYKEEIEKAYGGKMILIKYGITEEEIKENSDRLLGISQYLKSGDELILDITHAFRSLPFFMMNLLIFLQNVSNKKITVSHIHYGMLEATKELSYAPVVEMKHIMEVNDWIIGAYSFKNHGNAYKVAELMEKEDKSVAPLLKKFSDLMNLNYLYGLQSISQELSGLRTKEYQYILPNMVITPVIKDLFNQIPPNLSGKKHSLFQLRVAKWMLEHRKYAHAFLACQESIITYVCELNGKDVGKLDEREEAKKWLSHRPADRWELPVKCPKELKKVFNGIRELRNCIAHTIKMNKSAEDMIKKLSDAITDVEKIINAQHYKKR
ncbi:MAG: TIGR02221 family CRISPR-associated protein [Bacteroidales bacterium]|nr:TIGR02221 family CRISPR-associated protein [Bacteroidales bacterium]